MPVPQRRVSDGAPLRHDVNTNSGEVGEPMGACCCPESPCCQFVQRYRVLCIGQCDSGSYIQGSAGGVRPTPELPELQNWNNQSGYGQCARVKHDPGDGLQGWVNVTSYPAINTTGATEWVGTKGFTAGDIVKADDGTGFKVYVCNTTYPDPPGPDYTFDNIPATGVKANWTVVAAWTFDANPITGVRPFWSNETIIVKEGAPFLNQDGDGNNICDQAEDAILQAVEGAGGDCGFRWDLYGQKNLGVCPDDAPDTFPENLTTVQIGGDPCAPCMKSACLGDPSAAFLDCEYRVTLQGSWAANPATCSSPSVCDGTININQVVTFFRCSGVSHLFEYRFDFPEPLVDGDPISVGIGKRPQDQGWVILLTIKASATGNIRGIQIGEVPVISRCLPDGTFYDTTIAIRGGDTFTVDSGAVSIVP